MSDPGDVQEVNAVSDLSLIITNLYHLHFCHLDCELIQEYTICTGSWLRNTFFPSRLQKNISSIMLQENDASYKWL